MRHASTVLAYMLVYLIGLRAKGVIDKWAIFVYLPLFVASFDLNPFNIAVYVYSSIYARVLKPAICSVCIAIAIPHFIFLPDLMRFLLEMVINI